MIIFAAMIMVAHMSACVWIYLGHIQDDYIGEWQQIEGSWVWIDDEDQPGIRETWMVNYDFAHYDEFQQYVFSIYWVFESITTVGYGDYTGNRSIEYIFTIFLEFIGVTFFSVMTARMQTFAQRDGGYEDLLQRRL